MRSPLGIVAGGLGLGEAAGDATRDTVRVWNALMYHIEIALLTPSRPGSQALDLRIHKYHSVLGTACVTHVAGELAWVLNIHQPRVWILTIHQPHEIARFLHTRDV